MSWCDDILGIDPNAEADHDRYGAFLPRALALPTEDIARGWRIVSTTPYRHRTLGEAVFIAAPRALSGRDPGRALDLVLMIIEREPDDRVVAFLAYDLFFSSVLRGLDADLMSRLERAAERGPRLGLVLGLMKNMVCGRVPPAKFRQRLRRLMTIGTAFPWIPAEEVCAEKVARYAALDAPSYARRWTKAMGRSPVENAMDDEHEALVGAQHLLREHDPARLVAITGQIAELEKSTRILHSYPVRSILHAALPLAEGPWLDALIGEIGRSEVFADLISATSFQMLQAPIPLRIEAALQAKLGSGQRPSRP